MEALVDLRVLAVITPEKNGHLKVYGFLNSEAQRLAVHTPIDEMMKHPSIRAQQGFKIPVEEEAMITKQEHQDILDNILRWMNND